MGRSKASNFIWGGQKAGVRGYGENPKIRVIFAKFPLLRKIQILSHKLLVRQTSHHHHSDEHVQKATCRKFQVIMSSSSWSKTILCIFKEQIWLPNRKCYEKNKLCFDSLSQREALSIFLSQHINKVIICRGPHSVQG